MMRLLLLALMSFPAVSAIAETAAAEAAAPRQHRDEQGHGPGHGHGHGPQRGQELMVDLRQPLRMSPQLSARQLANMREHLQNIQAIVMALSVGDFAGIAERAQGMGHREGTRRMCQQFSGGGEGFMEMAMGFHDSADALAEAAGTHDTDAVIDALGQTLARCNACHATFRQEVVQSP